MIYYLMTYDDKRFILTLDSKLVLDQYICGSNLNWKSYLLYSKHKLKDNLIFDYDSFEELNAALSNNI